MSGKIMGKVGSFFVRKHLKALNALDEFKRFVLECGKSFEHLSPKDTTSLMTMFYAQVRAEDCNSEDDKDMLLFQWGTYDWGSGEFFEYDITRQFIFSEYFQSGDDQWEEDVIWQLSLTLKLLPTFDLKEIKPGFRWCEKPDEVHKFMQFIDACDATEAMQSHGIQSVELTFENTE
jgi:hypothetical protein